MCIRDSLPKEPDLRWSIAMQVRGGTAAESAFTLYATEINDRVCRIAGVRCPPIKDSRPTGRTRWTCDSRPRDTLEALDSLRTCRPSCPLNALIPLHPLDALRSRHALETLNALGSRGSCRPLKTQIPLRALDALGSSYALEPLDTLRSRRTRCALKTLIALRALDTLRPCHALKALRTLRSR
jgi:hypothetical protein